MVGRGRLGNAVLVNIEKMAGRFRAAVPSPEGRAKFRRRYVTQGVPRQPSRSCTRRAGWKPAVPGGRLDSFTASMRRTHAGSVRSQETPGKCLRDFWESLTTRLAADDRWTLLELGLNRQAIFDGYYDQRERRSGIVRH